MKQRKVIFRDQEIVEFCLATKDTNEIHNPEFMEKLGKRVIVPGMFALASTVNLVADELKQNTNFIKVLFNSLLSSGDFATLVTSPLYDSPNEIRLSAINSKDTLTSKEECTRMGYMRNGFTPNPNGIPRILPLERNQIFTFSRLVGLSDRDVANFLFAVAYASQALLTAIDHPETEVEEEIRRLISAETKVSPFYQTLEIQIPEPFPVFIPENEMEYYIHFERERANKIYTAHVRCRCAGALVFHSRYTLVGIPDIIILRMAKDLHAVKNPASIEK
jgi:hypothetical protein